FIRYLEFNVNSGPVTVVCRVSLVLKVIFFGFVFCEDTAAVRISFNPFAFGDAENIFKRQHVLTLEALPGLVRVLFVECAAVIKLHYLFPCEGAYRIALPAGKNLRHVCSTFEGLVMHYYKYTVLCTVYIELHVIGTGVASPAEG